MSGRVISSILDVIFICMLLAFISRDHFRSKHHVKEHKAAQEQMVRIAQRLRSTSKDRERLWLAVLSQALPHGWPEVKKMLDEADALEADRMDVSHLFTNEHGPKE